MASDESRDGSSVVYESTAGIAWLTIDRPEASNALDAGVREGLWAGFRRFNEDDSALVLVLTGSGERAFCAGADLKEMASDKLEVPPPDFLPHLGVNIDVPKPTIAAVNGAAYAGGFLLAQMCDLCVAADSARFAITEAKVGRGAPWASYLPWLVPPRVAMQMLLTGEPISAQRAFEVGLVNQVVGLSDLRQAARQLAGAIISNAPLSVRAAKRMVRSSILAPNPTAQRQADGIWEHVYRSEDAQEGPAAFSEHRSPRWKAR